MDLEDHTDRLFCIRLPFFRRFSPDSLCGWFSAGYFSSRGLAENAKQTQETILTSVFRGLEVVETTGFEPVTPCMSSKYSSQLSYASVFPCGGNSISQTQEKVKGFFKIFRFF